MYEHLIPVFQGILQIKKDVLFKRGIEFRCGALFNCGVEFRCGVLFNRGVEFRCGVLFLRHLVQVLRPVHLGVSSSRAASCSSGVSSSGAASCSMGVSSSGAASCSSGEWSRGVLVQVVSPCSLRHTACLMSALHLAFPQVDYSEIETFEVLVLLLSAICYIHASFCSLHLC